MDMLLREVSAPPPGAEPDEFVLSDGTIDRIGDVIDPKGWQLDRIKTAPPVLYNHNKDEQIGRWENIRQVGNQLVGVLIAWGFALVGTIVILKITDLATGFRANEEQEMEGLDISQHGEEAYYLES